jgi:acetyl esterase/lipase
MAALEAGRPPSLAELRRETLVGLRLLDDRARRGVDVRSLRLELDGRTLEARFYRAETRAEARGRGEAAMVGRARAEAQPLIVYFHFGGCVLGSLATCDTACSIFADEARCTVLAVAYRLAPEHRYPCAADDATDAFRWACRHAAELGADPARIAVAGDSAGGYLAGVVCIDQRDRGACLPALQVLLYPVINWDRRGRVATPFDGLYPLSRTLMDWFGDQYLRAEQDAFEPRCSLARTASVAGLPPAIVALAGHDLLHDEGGAYAARLRAAGVYTELHRFATLPHAFSAMTGAIPAAREAMRLLARRAGALLHGAVRTSP